ncbi:hypothetical protein EV193_11329 [Herbihabitans rhizosphaerae]|uniref:Uncharacterized protein n=1 Tax=Herbihabitans rhizosphaerae TaxID=1872711 RepID=A0A4Q7KH64_9PSEU|nr:hypothetical protein [Herbihabitans rhizosphaerae]RZS32188.1 hypothetical protein EV193_11329 [Herbihabitans rhizosphaerae]
MSIRLDIRQRIVALTGAAAVALASATVATASVPTPATGHGWTGTWASAAQHPGAGPFEPDWSTDGFADQSVRQVVRVSTGGAALRITLSNVYGTKPLRLTGATVAKTSDQASVRPDTVRPLAFHGSPATVIPVGRQATSDGLGFPVSPLERLTVTLYFAEPTGPATFHRFATAETYRASGDRRYDAGGAFSLTDTSTASYFLAGVDVLGKPGRARSWPSAIRSPTAWARPRVRTTAIPTNWPNGSPAPTGRRAWSTPASAATGC